MVEPRAGLGLQHPGVDYDSARPNPICLLDGSSGSPINSWIASNTTFVGRVSPEALAAVALGNIYFFVVAIFGQGVIMALDPIVAQALGADDQLAAR